MKLRNEDNPRRQISDLYEEFYDLSYRYRYLSYTLKMFGDEFHNVGMKMPREDQSYLLIELFEVLDKTNERLSETVEALSDWRANINWVSEDEEESEETA